MILDYVHGCNAIISIFLKGRTEETSGKGPCLDPCSSVRASVPSQALRAALNRERKKKSKKEDPIPQAPETLLAC